MDDSTRRIWIGSELGYLKSVDASKNIVKNYGEGNQEGRNHAASALAWKDDKEEKILIGTKSGQIRTFSVDTESFDDSFLECGETSIVGVMVHDGTTVACDTKGVVSVWDGNERKFHKQIGDEIRTIKQNKYKRNYMASGGKENNLKLFDVEQIEKPVFAAKNVRNDSLDLRRPVWVTDIDFIDGEECKIVVGSGYHKIQVYDTRKQRRPIDEINWEEYPITSISMASNGNDLIVGNTTGSMASIDLRKKQKNGSFKGIAGSISSIKCHQTQGFVICAGLDRFLRIYDEKTRGLLQKFYLKSRLDCTLLSEHLYGDDIFGKKTSSESADIKKKEIGNTEGNDDGDDDEIWNEMEVAIDDTKEKRKKKKLDNGESKKAKKKKVSTN